MAESPIKTALVVAGQVFAKNEFPGKDGRDTRYSVDLAVAGLKMMLTLNLPFEEWVKVELMSILKTPVSFNMFKGNVYWNKVTA